MRLLIAYDGSRCAEAALNDLTHAGLPAKGEALVVSVAEVWLPPPPPSALEIAKASVRASGVLSLERKNHSRSQALTDAEERATRAAASLRLNFPKWKIKPESAWGSPSWELFSRAEEWKADLIVVGSHGRTALGRFFLGSISQWLLNEARCSVRVARGNLDAPDFPARLVLALDGSRSANAALAQLAARNWPDKTEVRVITVDQPLAVTYVGGMSSTLRKSIESFNRRERHKSQRLIKNAVEKLKSAGLRASGEVIDGDPKKVLVRIAKDWRADCVFVGATGLSNTFERFLLGSTAGAIAARASCSVEVVRNRRRSSRRKATTKS